MGRIAQILSRVSGIVTINAGAGTETAQHFQGCGDDAPPLQGDYAVVVPVPGQGNSVTVAFVDPEAVEVATEGEKRIYSRMADGVIAASVHLRADGSITLSNAGGSFELSGGGDVTVSGTLTAAAVVAPSVVADGVEVAGHVHTQPNDSNGDTELPTDPMMAGP